MTNKLESKINPDTVELPKCTLQIKLVGGVIFLDDADMEKYNTYLKQMRDLLLDPVPLKPFMYSVIQSRKRKGYF